VGRKRGGGPEPKENHFSFLFPNSKFCDSPKFKFLELKMAFSQVDPKTKVVQNLILYNIALGHILEFQRDFKLRIQSPFLNQNPIFLEYFLKAKFGEILNTKLAPKIMLKNSR
jgi:hypothetical protein